MHVTVLPKMNPPPHATSQLWDLVFETVSCIPVRALRIFVTMAPVLPALLPAQPQPVDERLVALLALAFDVIKQTSPLANHDQKAAA